MKFQLGLSQPLFFELMLVCIWFRNIGFASFFCLPFLQAPSGMFKTLSRAENQRSALRCEELIASFLATHEAIWLNEANRPSLRDGRQKESTVSWLGLPWDCSSEGLQS
jgi:hypothetical protein